MFYYSFNDCFCTETDFGNLLTSLGNSIRQYRDIKNQYPNHIQGILTDRDISNFKINGDSDLLNLILSLGREEKNYALSLFKKFPIENFYPDLNVENILEKKYIITIDKTNYDGINAKINSLHNGFLFSLGIHDDIRKDQLEIKELDEKKPSCFIDNLFGEVQNSKYNISQIEKKLRDSKEGFEKFLTLFKNPLYYESFKTEYESLSNDLQQRIYDRLETAVKRKLPTPFAADNDLIKDVTPSTRNTSASANKINKNINSTKVSKSKVYELRIFNPVCVRLYFHEDIDNIYLASIKRKPAKKTQANDILTSLSTINSLKLTKK